ncbi:MAG: FAD-dependent oxidoreductase, partial [Deltaproteobacteria bacterium]|nr:FAD-dependent oxidoreductase [Deltaproteobacteria bacterium]
RVANYPGVEAASGAEIVATMRRQAVSFGARVLGQAEVTRMDLAGPEKVVEVEDEGRFVAPAVILATGAFVFIGYVPNTAWLKGVVDLNERGEILADDMLRTSVPGVFAAGDARAKRYRQITTAVADGTIAALSATEYVSTYARRAAKPPARARILRSNRGRSAVHP